MRPSLILVTVLGVVLSASTAALAAPAPPQPGTLSQAMTDLTWFVAGLRDLGKSRDARLKLLPAQAKKILPILDRLAADKILVVEIPERRSRPNGQSFGGSRQDGGLTERQRQEMQARQQKMAGRVQQDINKMDGMLRQAQSDYIMSLDFDPAVYGLDRSSGLQRLRGQEGRPSGAELQKLIKARQEARQRLVKLNQEVLTMVRKLAAGK